MKRNLFLVAVATLACAGASPVGTKGPQGCLQNVQVVVSNDATPVFSWAPACGMSSLSVETVPSSVGETGQAVWGFSVPENNPVGPAIRYGQAPSGATLWVAPQPLVAGTRYHIRVAQTVGGDGLHGSGQADLTH